MDTWMGKRLGAPLNPNAPRGWRDEAGNEVESSWWLCSLNWGVKSGWLNRRRLAWVHHYRPCLRADHRATLMSLHWQPQQLTSCHRDSEIDIVERLGEGELGREGREGREGGEGAPCMHASYEHGQEHGCCKQAPCQNISEIITEVCAHAHRHTTASHIRLSFAANCPLLFPECPGLGRCMEHA
eukprot:355816-Chlamydomonas_euryale.AAC.4